MTTTEHSPAGTSLTPLRRARERFLSGRPLPEDVPEEVVASWRRARFFGVPHDLQKGTAGPSRATGAALLGTARPALERIAPALGTGRCVLLLTDERPRVLWSAGSAAGPEQWADLSERTVGPNSAALALRSRRRAEVHGPEHFLDRWQDVSAVSVPVTAPETGQALGTVTVVSPLWSGAGPHPGAALAEAAAAAVEAELLARARRTERVLLDAYLRAAQGQGVAVAVLDGRNRLVSAAAERMLSPQALDALERTAIAVRRKGVPVDPDLPAGAGCTARITPVRHEGAAVGVVAVLEPLGGAVASPPRRSVALIGSSVPWRHATRQAVALARVPEPLLVTGERGTGKTALARELLGERSARVADAAQDSELGPALAELAAGRPLLLRHAERLAQSGVAALNSLLDRHPDARLLVTYTPGAPAGPCLQRLLDTLAARSVTLPALRERPEDIRDLLPVLAPRPAPGQPPLTWTLDALRALERYPWPGNVTELAHVVRALAEDRRASGPVHRAELPDPVREGPAARPLSPMEHAERTTILEALRRHGGNKARTAAALGIGRATLYRKLRGYRG
ncbi:helix-turn-helix domain-containing protein [Streptomyces sp. MI02-2A]|uniref:sigma-54-dependent Fis family transcriptional regulator n=1 Tax=unclassified Streptomyces TaxID=2593676 RepID=UPI000741326F|nr:MULTISPECIES: helix-turn-helix domain-containing protein [unclassified Streptomyces]KUJ54186.1 regulator [Streptomyces sp. NRRL F-5122]MDX3261880.1 helix-turn-helix domain-containing protein [Streptomyces sp. MI02-2A]